MQPPDDSVISYKVFKLSRDSGDRRTSVGETVSNGTGDPPLEKQQRLDRWLEHF